MTIDHGGLTTHFADFESGVPARCSYHKAMFAQEEKEEEEKIQTILNVLVNFKSQ